MAEAEPIEEFEKVMNENKENCNKIECPVCRIFCLEWMDFGKAVYKLINDKDITPNEAITVNRYAVLVANVLKDHEKKVAVVVANE